MTVLTFTEYIEPKKTAAGKMTPGKYRANGVDYVFPRGAQVELNKSYDCEVETTTNGNFRNHSVKNFFAVRQLEPPVVVEPEKIAPTRETVSLTSTSREGGQSPTPAASSWEHKDRLISRQVAFKGAVEIVAAQIASGKFPADGAEEAVDFFTERFFMLIVEPQETATSASPTNGNVRRPDAPVVSPANTPSRLR